MDASTNPPPPQAATGTPLSSGTPDPSSESSSAKLVNKWAVEMAPEATINAIAEAKAYAEAHVEMVIPKRRGRPRKNPLPEGAEGATPTPAPVPKRIALPKFRPPPKPKAKARRKKKRDDYDDSDDDSEGDFVPEPLQRRQSDRGSAKRAGFFSDGDVDSEEEEALDENVAYRVANQRVSLRQKKRLNYADHFRGDDTDEEDDTPKKRGGKKTGGRPRAASMGDLESYAPLMEEEHPEDEDDEEEYNKPTKTGLVPDMAYRSVQIERVLAFRARKVNTADPHSFPTNQPNKLAGPNPPPEGSAAAFAMAARESGALTDVLMTINTHIPGFATPSAHNTPAATPAPNATNNTSSNATAAESSFATPAATPTVGQTAATASSTAADPVVAPVASNPNSMDITQDSTTVPISEPAPIVAPVPTKVAPVKPLYPLPKPLETHPLLHPGHQYEYLVKYKQRSFVHAEWVPQVVIERAKLGKQRLQRFLAKGPECDPDLPFDPEYVEVDRVLDQEERDGTLYYYVKWQGLPYNECTWESSEEVNDARAVEEYERHNTEPAVRVDYNAPTPRPAPGEWSEKKDAEFKDGNQLRPYQHEGMNWLRYCWYNHRNSILADEMGLGKTVQTVSMLWYLYRYRNIRGPFMIIAPLSTIPHWRRELENWTEMNCLVYHGNAEARQIIRDYEFHYLDDNGRPKLKNMFKFHVIVTTYEMILTDAEILRPIRWKYIAIDEAHRLKNKSSRVLNEFLTFRYEHLLLLTGTPIQNNTQELWTLLNLLDPVQFSSAEDFVAAFGNLKDAEQVKRLHDILKPFLLRRMKDDVDKTIAPKEETIIEVELTTIQKKYYRAILERSFDNLVQGSKSRSALPSLLNIMMQLRKCCNHPYLLKGVEEAELGIQEQNVEGATPGDTLIESSGKLVLIDKLLPRLKQEGHKILIFSQMVRVIDILQEYLNARYDKSQLSHILFLNYPHSPPTTCSTKQPVYIYHYLRVWNCILVKSWS
jgi:superfamily II DNA or RNA helicase